MASEKLDAVVDRITYRNEDTTYTVLQLSSESGSKLTAVGNLPAIQPGERLRMTGTWRVHPRYGVQFHIEEYRSVPPATTEAIERYLASGLVKGVGPETARRLVQAFGKDTLDVIANEPHRLTEVPGIGPKKASAIAAASTHQEGMREAVLFLQELGVTVTFALRIFRQFGTETIPLVRTNPYRLADEVHGIGFKRADEIAQNLGIAADSLDRLQAAIRHALLEGTNEGHVYMPESLLIERVRELGVPTESMATALKHLADGQKIVIEDGDGEADLRIYLSTLHRAEVSVARRLKILRSSPAASGEQREPLDYGELGGSRLSDEQEQAVQRAVEDGCLIITGGPGTGKTTVVRAICRMFEAQNLTFELAAPTGRAAQRLAEATGKPARTLHRLLEVRHAEGTVGGPLFARNEDRPLDVDAVIVDEASMVDVVLMDRLLAAIRPGTRFILIGDEDQLASVGPGQVLADMIASGSIPVVQLTQVFRQAALSLIVQNAHRIRNGELPIPGRSDQDFFFMEAPNEAIPQMINELVGSRLPAFLEGNPVTDIQVLTPIRRGPVGVDALNKQLQGELNTGLGPEVEIGERILKENDKVMQIRNNYDNLVFNGDIGRVVGVLPKERVVEVAFPDGAGERIVRYEQGDLDQLVHAYAISVHKSQGSEYPCIVMPITWIMPALMTRHLLYTAVTRARRLAVLVGNRAALAAYVRNEGAGRRFTGLDERLRELIP